MAFFCFLAGSWRDCGAFMEDQAVEVAGQIGERQFRLCPLDADGSNKQPEAVPLVREHMLDPATDCGFGGIGTGRHGRHRLSLHRDCQDLRVWAGGCTLCRHGFDETLAEDDGELDLGHGPLTGRHFSLFLRPVQDQIKQLGCSIVVRIRIH
jgi:hypothetical protein